MKMQWQSGTNQISLWMTFSSEGRACSSYLTQLSACFLGFLMYKS